MKDLEMNTVRAAVKSVAIPHRGNERTTFCVHTLILLPDFVFVNRQGAVFVRNVTLTLLESIIFRRDF